MIGGLLAASGTTSANESGQEVHVILDIVTWCVVEKVVEAGEDLAAEDESYYNTRYGAVTRDSGDGEGVKGLGGH